MRNEAKRFLIVTDGTLTEVTYFERLNQLSDDVIVAKKVQHFGDLVEKACEMKDNGNFDKVFIVCDIDEHCSNPRSRKAFEAMLVEAAQFDIEVVCSNEAFEIWILAHKEAVPSTAKSRKVVQTLAKQAGLLTGNNAKLVVAREITSGRVNKACQEAKRLRRAYGSNILEDGPLTEVDKIVDRLNLP